MLFLRKRKKGFTLIEAMIVIAIIGIVIAAALPIFGITSCTNNSADRIQAEQTEKAMSEANRQVGMPNIVNFQQKKLMKMIYELCDKGDLITYAYIKSDYQGKLFFIGKCIGYGIPFSAQYSNPEVYKKVLSAHWEKMPQPEPNGMFMPTSSSATWLMMIDPTTKKPSPVYIEPEIVVSPFKLH